MRRCIFNGLCIVMLLSGCSEVKSNEIIQQYETVDVNLEKVSSNDQLEERAVSNDKLEEKIPNNTNRYVSKKLGFQIELPKSWEGKYKIIENDFELICVHDIKSEERGKILFGISIDGTTEEWKQQEKRWMEDKDCLTKLGERNDLVYTFFVPNNAGVGYDEELMSSKVLYKEFLKMIPETTTIINTFQFSDTGTQEKITKEWYCQKRDEIGYWCDMELEVAKLYEELKGRWKVVRRTSIGGISNKSPEEQDAYIGEIVDVDVEWNYDEPKLATENDLLAGYRWSTEAENIKCSKTIIFYSEWWESYFWIENKLYVEYGNTLFELEKQQNTLKEKIYTNDEMGISISIPESWEGKYILKDDEGYIEFTHSVNGEKGDLIFLLREYGTVDKWADEAGSPWCYVGQKDGKVYVVRYASECNYDTTTEEGKKLVEEMQTLLDDMGGYIGIPKHIKFQEFAK